MIHLQKRQNTERQTGDEGSRNREGRRIYGRGINFFFFFSLSFFFSDDGFPWRFRSNRAFRGGAVCCQNFASCAERSISNQIAGSGGCYSKEEKKSKRERKG